MPLERRDELQKQLERMGRAIAVVGGARVVGGAGSALKGRKPRRNIVVRQARLGQVVAQDYVG